MNSRPVMSAFLDCCQSAGIQTQENSMTADAAVIWSVLWHGRMKTNQAVYEHYRKQNKPVIVIDIGVSWTDLETGSKSHHQGWLLRT
jgi:hypothetical protein